MRNEKRLVCDGARDVDLLLRDEPHEQLRAETVEDDAERELLVEAGAQRHDEADEAPLVLDARRPGEDAADDVAGDDAHEHRVDDALDRDLDELVRTERLTATEQRERAGEDDADRERREQVRRPVAVAEPEERTGDHVGGVLDAEEHDGHLVDEEDREREPEVDPCARAVAEPLVRACCRGRHGLRHNLTTRRWRRPIPWRATGNGLGRASRKGKRVPAAHQRWCWHKARHQESQQVGLSQAELS